MALRRLSRSIVVKSDERGNGIPDGREGRRNSPLSVTHKPKAPQPVTSKPKRAAVREEKRICFRP